MTEQTLTALYDTRDAAAAVRDELVRLGVPGGRVTVQGNGGGAGTAGAGEDQGFWASLKDVLMPEDDRETFAEGVRRGGYLLTARVPGDLVERAYDVVERAEPADLDERSETWRRDGWSGAGVTRTTTATTESLAATGQDRAAGSGSLGAAATGGNTVQLAEEQLRVGKREVGRGAVRVRSYVTERPVEEQVTLRDETVRVERRPVDREVRAGDAVFQERTIEAVERDEEAVVSKTARVTEEITLGKDVETRTETVRDTVRKQDVEIVDEREGHGHAAGLTGGTEVETGGVGTRRTTKTTDRPGH